MSEQPPQLMMTREKTDLRRACDEPNHSINEELYVFSP